ncbi:hypothetical protein BYT27DRAFT_7215749 [Phlegmacium glaucopus]|nr:hypothetical protein BYT27DRAFT_7215749 [Phlegmacium glaucopus]
MIGMPLQFSTDCGSETTQLFGLANALYVHNISIECSWLCLQLEWGDNAVLAFKKGRDEGVYNPNDPAHCCFQRKLGQWLWPKLLRKSLREFMDFRNGVHMRNDNEKAGPSSMSQNEAFSLPENWGGCNCLLKVDMVIIAELKEAMGGDEILDFVSKEFSEKAQVAYDSLGVTDLNSENVWYILLFNLKMVALNNFPLLDQDTTTCEKCKAQKPGMSTAEYAVINDKPQCGSCGIMLGSLKQALCNGCIAYYKSGKDVLFSILKLHGAAKLLLNNTHTMEDEDVTKANSTSDKRLGVGPSRTTKNTATGLHQFKNLDKAKVIIAERKTKKIEAQMLNSGIRVVATVWMTDKHKLKQIGQIRVSSVFEPTAGIRNSLDAVFEKHLNRARTMHDLYQEFINGRLGSISTLNSQTIEIRFAYQKDEIHPLEDEQAMDSAMLSATARKRKQTSSQFMVPARQQWTHDLPMKMSFFVHTKAMINGEGNVEFSINTKQEAIEIAEDWEKGQTLYEQVNEEYMKSPYVWCCLDGLIGLADSYPQAHHWQYKKNAGRSTTVIIDGCTGSMERIKEDLDIGGFTGRGHASFRLQNLYMVLVAFVLRLNYLQTRSDTLHQNSRNLVYMGHLLAAQVNLESWKGTGYGL